MRRRTVIIALSVALITLLALASSAMAADPPDSLAFEAASAQSSPSVTVYRDLLETGDLLAVGQYNIAYASLPEDSAQTNYIGRVYKNTTSLGANTPYPYTDQGYGKGVISWYLTQAETETAGYTNSSGVWSVWPLTTLGVDLATNPTIFPPADQRAASVIPIASSAFSSGSGQETNQLQLATKIVQIARGLEAAWGVSMVNENGRLNSTVGGPYFQLAIPGSLSMAPNAFGSSSQSPTIPTPQPTPGGPGTLAETAENRFDGTFWLTPAFDSTGATLGLPAGAFEGILSALMILVVTGIGLKFGGPGGAAMGFAVGCGVILPIFTLLGFINWAFGILGIGILVVGGIIRATRDMVG